jgi:hypothetical protein
VLWSGLLLITYWWEADGGVTDLAHWASGLTSIGRLTGLWSAQLLLVQVLLMSRLLRWSTPSGVTGWPGSTGWSASPPST